MSKWIAKFADNGWMDWYCPHCGRWVLNDDVHVTLDWKYCPYCGEIVDDSHTSNGPASITDSYILGYITDLIRTSWKAKSDKNMGEYDRLSKQIKALNDFYDDWKKDFKSNEEEEKNDQINQC